jgi:hypothetical protein
MVPVGDPVGKIVHLKEYIHEPLQHKLQEMYQSMILDYSLPGAQEFFGSTRPAPVPPDPKWKPGVKAVHHRGGFQFIDPGWLGMPVWIGDQIITDNNTLVAIEFIIGGRVGINKDSWVTIVSERSVADTTIDLKKIILRKAGMLARMYRLKEPLEIQTNGGVFGIKG